MATTKALIDKFLTKASKMYQPKGFIADQVLAPLNVKQNSGKLAGYGMNHLRIVNTVMGGRGKAPRFESITRSSDSYYVENNGLEGLVTKDDYKNVELPYDAEKDEVYGLKTVLMLSREKGLADNLGSTSILTQNTTLSGSAQFSDYVNSDPLSKAKTAQDAVYDGCGVYPDTAIMSAKVMNCLSYHPGILSALGFQYNRAGTLKEAEIASALKVDKVMVGGPKYNSAALGQTDSLSDVWGKNLIFAVCPGSAQKYQVALGYSVRIIGEQAYQVYKFDVTNPPESKGLIVTDNYDDLLSNVLAAYLIKDAIA